MNQVDNLFQAIKRRVSRHPLVDPKKINRIRLAPCLLAEKMHRRKWRYFAHTHHKDYTICIARDIKKLRDDYVAGILFHEFGHLLQKDRSEAGANKVIKKLFGVQIRYDKKYRNLEYI